jgi:hypothetical protein
MFGLFNNQAQEPTLIDVVVVTGMTSLILKKSLLKSDRIKIQTNKFQAGLPHVRFSDRGEIFIHE